MYVFLLWITVLDPCTKLLLALSFVCRLDFTSGHESPLMFFLSWKQIEPCSKETVLKMRSVHESSKWFTELQTRATLFRHVEDSPIAHHRRYSQQTYCVRLVHLMGFCPSLVFWRCRYDICFCELVFYLFSCLKSSVHKKRTKLKHGCIFQTNPIFFYPPYFFKGFLILSCHFHLCISIFLLPSCFPEQYCFHFSYPVRPTGPVRPFIFDLIIFSFGEG